MNPSLINDATALLAPAKNFESHDRRTWLKTALGMGYAAACVPLCAQTAIRTSSEGLLCGEAMVNVNGFQMPVYRSVPLGKTDCPVVLVVSEIFGVHEYIADITRRLAQQGYMAIAPELMLRQGDPSSYAEMGKLIAEVVSKVPDEQVMDDLDACVAWAATQGGDVSKLGITGFCWGGRITWLYAAHNPRVKAGVAWYGRLNGPVSALNPRHAIDLAGQLKAPVLGLYGSADTGIPVAAVEKMQAALATGNAAAKRSSIHVYPNAPHAFHADYRPSYREAEAKDGWQRMLRWFDTMK
ncbi:MAG: dienelactone hydrolase family protein [Burkholderiaceae bacterium]|jgi:carboxymethylenebutenolidase|nr:dienelactone hydrolase family protein [Burkholderiaceae bacterium]